MPNPAARRSINRGFVLVDADARLQLGGGDDDKPLDIAKVLAASAEGWLKSPARTSTPCWENCSSFPGFRVIATMFAAEVRASACRTSAACRADRLRR